MRYRNVENALISILCSSAMLLFEVFCYNFHSAKVQSPVLVALLFRVILDEMWEADVTVEQELQIRWVQQWKG